MEFYVSNSVKARGFYEDGLKVANALREQLGTPESLRDHAVLSDRLGELEFAAGNLPKAREWFSDNVQTAKALLEKGRTPDGLRDLIISLYKLALASPAGEKADPIQQALEAAGQLAMNFPEYPGNWLENTKQACALLEESSTPNVQQPLASPALTSPSFPFRWPRSW